MKKVLRSLELKLKEGNVASETKLAEALRSLIKAWQERSKHNNLNKLARKSKVSYGTLHRMANSMCDEVRIENAIGVLSVIANPMEKQEFLKTHYPLVSKSFEVDAQSRLPLLASGRRPDFAPLHKLLAEVPGFMLVQRLLAKPGIKISEVERLYGEYGLSVVNDDLVPHDLVRVEDGICRIPFEETSPLLEVSRDRVLGSAKSFNPKSAEAGCGILHTISEGVTLTAAKEIAEVMQEAIAKTRRIRDANPGDHVFVANFVLQLADPERALTEGANQ